MRSGDENVSFSRVTDTADVEVYTLLWLFVNLIRFPTMTKLE